MKRGWVVAYRLPKGISDLDRVKFRQRFMGATTTSGGGKYKFHREGLLERLPHRMVRPGVLLVGEDGRRLVEGFLREWGAKVWAREVVLQSEDRAYLTPREPGP